MGVAGVGNGGMKEGRGWGRGMVRGVLQGMVYSTGWREGLVLAFE